MKRLAIIGSGDLGQQLANLAENDQQFQVVGFYDDFKLAGDLAGDYKIMGKLNHVLSQFKEGLFDEVLIAIGYNHMHFRKEVYDSLKGRVPFAKLIHSTCIVSTSSKIKEGVVIYPGSIIDQNVTISENVLINLGCCISHDTILGGHSFFAPRVAIGGFSIIGESCVVGINSTIIDNIKICNNTQIGAGAVVIKNIQENGVYVGNPSKYIR